MTDLATYVPK